MKCIEVYYLQSDWHLCKWPETCKTTFVPPLTSPLYHGVYVFPRVLSSSCSFLLCTADNSDIYLSNELLFLSLSLSLSPANPLIQPLTMTS